MYNLEKHETSTLQPCIPIISALAIYLRLITDMKSFFYRYWHECLLFLTYLVFVAVIQYCYPMAQFSWDGNYYVGFSIKLAAGIRPIGYSVFLKILYKIIHSILFVVYVQYFIYYVTIYLFLKTINIFFYLTKTNFYILGVFLLIEPAALYNCFNILSDLLFSCLTLLFIS